MRNLSSVAWRTFRRSFGRFALTASGIALGVAILFGVLVANQSSTAALEGAFWTLDAPTVNVRAFGSGAYVTGETASGAAHLPRVERAWAYIGLPTQVAGAGEEHASLWMNATEVLVESKRDDDRQAQKWDLDGREPAAGAREITITTTKARQLGVEKGGELDLVTPAGREAFTVTGLWSASPGPTPEGAAASSVDTVRRLLEQGEVFRDAWLRLEQGTDVAKWVDTHASAMPPGTRLVPAGAGERAVRDLLAVTTAVFTSIAAIALFAAAFLIYLTLSMAVVERTRMYGTMRALGARGRQVLRLVIGEALVLGAVSSIVGLVIGVGVAAGLVRLMAGIYGVGSMRIVVPPGSVAAAVGLGLGATVIAAFVPARRAARVAPVAAIRGTLFEEHRLSRAWIVGAFAFAAGIALPFLPGRRGLDVGSLLVLLGAVLLVPLVMRPLARVVGYATRGLARGVGDVGVMHLVKQRSRSAYTLALVMVMLAAVFAIGSANLSIQGTLNRDLETRFGSDVAVWGQPTLAADVESEVRNVSGVDRTTPVRFTSTRTSTGTPIELFVIDPASYFKQQSFSWVRGDDASAARAFGKGGAIVASETMLFELGVQVGHHISLETTDGLRRFEVVGSYASIELENRAAVGVVDGARWFGTSEANGLFVAVADDAESRQVEKAIEHAFEGRSGVFVQQVADEAASIRANINRYFAIFFAIVLVAGLVGLLGLANTLAMSIVQRTREIGVLRAVGTHRRQLAAMVVVESATLSLVALVLAIPLGLLLSVMLVRTSASALGLVVHYEYPWLMVPVVGALAVGVALAAALAPSRRAARVEPVTALRFE